MSNETPPLASKSIQQALASRRKKRLLLIVFGLIMLGCAVGISLYAMRSSINAFRMPSEITVQEKQSGAAIRLGGFVEEGSVSYDGNNHVIFMVTDYIHSEKVDFSGLLPDLFREGQGVIVDGHFDGQGQFIASRVLAKHDENYVSKDVVDRLKAQGLWEEYQKRAQ